MSDSPYAPPQAVVRDAEPQYTSLERPWQVTRAVQCLWLSFAISLVQGAITLVQTYKLIQTTQQFWMGTGILVFSNALSILINVYIAKGRNWARILFFIIFGLSILGVIMFVFTLMSTVRVKPPGSIELLSMAVGSVFFFAGGYFLLTGPARGWFRAMKAQRSQQQKKTT